MSRCSDRTRLRRFHGPLVEFPEPYLTEALSGVGEHLALVVETGETLCALASCRTVDEGVAELAILVEDNHQRQGWGSHLLALLIASADNAGLSILRATVIVEQQWVLSALRAYGRCRSRSSFGVIDAELCLHSWAREGGARFAPVDGGPSRCSRWSADRRSS